MNVSQITQDNFIEEVFDNNNQSAINYKLFDKYPKKEMRFVCKHPFTVEYIFAYNPDEDDYSDTGLLTLERMNIFRYIYFEIII